MKLEEYYTVKELLQLNEESTPKNEFKPKFGNGAKRGSNDNEKAVKEITKNAEAYDNEGRKEQPRKKKDTHYVDYNKTTMDNFYESEVPDETKERWYAQACGYPSKYNMEHNDLAEYHDTKGNEEFIKQRANTYKEMADNKEMEAKSGLKARIKDLNGKSYKPNGGYKNVNENKPTKRLVFKNTTFLNESQVLAKVPDDYRVDENRFYMRDKTGTDYLVECVADPFGYVHMDVVNRINKNEINEELDKMRRLAGYNYSDDNKKIDKKGVEDMSESITNFRKMLNN